MIHFGRLSIVAAGVVLCHSLYAQTEPTSSIQVLPHSTDAFVLTLRAPTASRSIVVDDAKRVDIMVSALSADLSVDLVSPNRKRYSVGQKRAEFQSWISVVENVGANYRAILTDPLPGTWTLEVSAKKLTTDVDVVVNILLDSKVFVSLIAGDIEQRVGGVVALSLAAFEQATRLTTLTISSEVTRPDGSISSVLFRDDGRGIDYLPNDGLYAALIQVPIEGEYHVEAKVRGKASGRSFERTAAAQVRARRAVASVGDTFTDSGVDENADGLFDRITITPSITVMEAGKYYTTVRMRSGDKTVQKTNIASFSSGAASPVVSFPAEEITATFANDGPYAVEFVLLERREPDDVVFVDRRSDVGFTQAFRIQDLQRPRSRIVGTPTAVGFDSDNNGKFDQLRVAVDVEIELPAIYYSYSASMYDSNRDHVGSANGQAPLIVGRNRITAVFDGADIGRHGVDGPYDVGFSMHGPTSDAAAGTRFTTGPFSASQFEASQPDTVPPTLTVTMQPAVLWPPDHRMVEVVPAFDARDDRDPAPTVRLRRIDYYENDSLMPNPSPDVRVDDGRIFLLAARYGKFKGRTYLLTYVVGDRAGNETVATATVRVPHDQGR